MALVNKPVFTDKRTKDKIDLHLRDINDEITEQDIENVKTDVTDEGYVEESDTVSELEAEDMLEKKIKKDKSQDDGNNSNDVQSPWNIID